MLNKENFKEFWEDECSVDENSTSVISANLPYSTKQFDNWVYSNKGKVHSHHIHLFQMELDKDNWGSLESSFDEMNFMYLSHKEIIKINHNLIEYKNSNSVKVQRRKWLLTTTMKSASEIRKKSSREILKDILQ